MLDYLQTDDNVEGAKFGLDVIVRGENFEIGTRPPLTGLRYSGLRRVYPRDHVALPRKFARECTITASQVQDSHGFTPLAYAINALEHRGPEIRVGMTGFSIGIRIFI
jgi:hypothetical protein